MSLRALASCLSIVALAACGGGGGADAAAPPVAGTPATPPTTPASSPPAPAAPASTPGAKDGALSVAEFSPSTEEFPNPERGFYRWSESDLDRIAEDDAARAFSSGYRLMFSKLDISAYRGSDLPASVLDDVERSLARVRKSGLKLIVRVVYNYPDSEIGYEHAQDAPLAQVIKHLAQLKPVLQRNADVIAYMQAGFIGAWGEWHTSSNGLTAPASRTRIRDALLDALPSSRFIQIRYPQYVMDGSPTVPTLQAALSGAYRVGVHNDCFLASATDVGTYDEDAAVGQKQRDYVARLGAVAPFGGETCNPSDEAGARPRTTCADILDEGARYGLVYLNDGYYRAQFHDRWAQENCLGQVRQKMGYRVRLLKAAHAASAARGTDFAMTLNLRNEGWTRIFNPRGIELVFKDRSTGQSRRVPASGSDPRSWVPGGDRAEQLSARIPTDLAPGSYDVWIALPDADTRLAGDARFSIRWANADSAASGQQWDASMGAFSLGTAVQVK